MIACDSTWGIVWCFIGDHCMIISNAHPSPWFLLQAELKCETDPTPGVPKWTGTPMNPDATPPPRPQGGRTHGQSAWRFLRRRRQKPGKPKVHLWELLAHDQAGIDPCTPEPIRPVPSEGLANYTLFVCVSSWLQVQKRRKVGTLWMVINTVVISIPEFFVLTCVLLYYCIWWSTAGCAPLGQNLLSSMSEESTA